MKSFPRKLAEVQEPHKASAWMVLLALLGIFAAGIGVAVGVGWFVEYQKTHWTPDAVWIKLALFTALMAGAIITGFRPRWGRVKFWVTFVAVMSIRTFIYVKVLRQYSDLPSIAFSIITTVEWPIWLTILFWINYSREEAQYDD